MFKTETHLHVKETSPCSRIMAEEMVQYYYDAGYKTLIVSDHFQEGFFKPIAELPWSEQVDRFLAGYKAVQKAAEKFDMNVILSAEIRFNSSRNHYLLYGIDEAFLKARPDILDMTIETFAPYAKAAGVTIVQAHPLRDGKCIPTFEWVDGVEAYNANPRHENFTAETLKLAKEWNLPITGGSDTHRMEDIALCGIKTAEEIRTAEDYVRALMSGDFEIIGMGEGQ